MANTNGGAVEIKILTMDSQTHTVRVDKSVPVPTLKQQIAEVAGVFPAHQRLICRGKVLKDDQNLCAYHVEDGHTLHLVVKPPVDPSPETARDPPTHPVTDLRGLINRLSDQNSFRRQFVSAERGIILSFERVREELVDIANIQRYIGNMDAQRAFGRVLALRDEGDILNERVLDCLLQLGELMTDRRHLLHRLQADVIELARVTPPMVPAPAMAPAPAGSSQASSRPRREGDAPEAKRRRRPYLE